MNATTTTLVPQLHHATGPRYQVYRQARNGLHYHHGNGVDSPHDAVALFLSATPAFEGGGLDLWDYAEQRAVASAQWSIETTRMGFTVRTRSNVFHDEELATIGREIAQREALVQAIATELRMSA